MIISSTFGVQVGFGLGFRVRFRGFEGFRNLRFRFQGLGFRV